LERSLECRLRVNIIWSRFNGVIFFSLTFGVYFFFCVFKVKFKQFQNEKQKRYFLRKWKVNVNFIFH